MGALGNSSQILNHKCDILLSDKELYITPLNLIEFKPITTGS